MIVPKQIGHYLVVCCVLFFFSYSNTDAQNHIFNIKVDQFGYRPTAQKVAVISSPKEGFNSPSSYEAPTELTIIDLDDQSEVYTGEVIPWNDGEIHAQSGDKVWWFDFSDFSTAGDFYIVDKQNNVRSDVFTVSEHVYNHVLKHAVRMFYYQRCGVSKEVPFADAKWSDAACHIHDGQDLNCRSREGAGPQFDLSGGWHDAGDYNKYTSFTFSVLHELLNAYRDNPGVFHDNYSIPESGNGIPDLLDEIKFELDFLQKMMLDDGQVLAKVSVTEHQGASPASADQSSRYYAPALSSATRCLASIFAHAGWIFREIAALEGYADTLISKSKKAWDWIVLNPGYSAWDNSGFASANPERSEYDQEAYMITASVYLYLATGDDKYLQYFETNYNKLHPLQWNYWYGYEYSYERAMLDYCATTNANEIICQQIHESFKASMNGDEFMTGVLGETDAYRAYLKDDDYVWGSNSLKSRVGELFYDIFQYGIIDQDDLSYPNASEDYIHFIHGVNAIGKVMMTNMNELGAHNSANEMYHLWFGDGTDFDHALNSIYGPPPGYVTGGINKNYTHDASISGDDLVPPKQQPVQKWYKDWNTSWPENSWQITEPAIYYQAAYIMLLSKFASHEEIEIEIPERIVTRLNQVSLNTISYPSPVSDYLTIKTSGEILQNWKAIGLDGSNLSLGNIEVNKSSNELMLDLSKLSPGCYFLKLQFEEHSETLKILKK
jgi:endoglucanase